LIGVYQADITLPLDLPPGFATLRCEANGLVDQGSVPIQ
jgi:hypothetical protein